MPTTTQLIQFRSGTNANRLNTILNVGEPGYAIDTNRVYVGNAVVSGGNPIGMKNLGYTNFSGGNSGVTTWGEIGDLVFDLNSNLLYTLTSSDFPHVSAYRPYGTTYSPDNLTISSNNNIISVKLQSLNANYFQTNFYGPGLVQSGTEIKVAIGAGLGFDASNNLTIAQNGVTNSNLSNVAPNTIKGRLNSTGPVQDLTPAQVAQLLSGIVNSVPIGSVVDFAGITSTIPGGYLNTDGSVYAISAYPLLFSAIGNVWGYGYGDGLTFNVPNLSRKTTIGSGGTGSSVVANTVGSTGGEESHLLTQAEGKFEFGLGVNFQNRGNQTGSDSVGYVAGLTITNANGSVSLPYPIAGGTNASTNVGNLSASPHNNMPPVAVMLKIIRAY